MLGVKLGSVLRSVISSKNHTLPGVFPNFWRAVCIIIDLASPENFTAMVLLRLYD